MPRFGFDDEGVSMMTRGPGPLTLKRSRPTMEPAKVPASPCMLKCCAEVKDHETSCLMCASSRATVAYDMSIDTSFPEDEFLDEDFDLGPPPPSGPVLVRQNAMDMTASAEAKYAAMARKMNDVKSASAMPMAVPVLPPPRGAPGMMMVPPMFVRHSRSTN